MGHLTAEAASVPGLTELNHHILHPFLSVPVGPYNPYHWLFGCCGELPFEGLPGITKIPVTSFAERRGVSAVLREYHIVHL